jgi:hypothetical protein
LENQVNLANLHGRLFAMLERQVATCFIDFTLFIHLLFGFARDVSG